MIYAAEEPVTLGQLSSLFRAEALEERAARQIRAASQMEQGGAGGMPSDEPMLLVLAPADAQTAESAADEHAERPVSDVSIEQAVEHPEQVAASQPDGFAAEPDFSRDAGSRSGEGGAASAGEEQASGVADEARRHTRQQDREAREEIRLIIHELTAAYDQGDRGVEIREIAGGYRVATKPEYHDAVRSFVKSLKPPMKLSLQALETLAVIAYKQPVTAPEVSDIRGVDSGGVLGSLISRKLVTTAGRKQVIGRPILYKTTKEFLLRFGLKDLSELPSMEEFEKMAGELVETEASVQLDLAAAPGEQGETPMQQSEPDSALKAENTAASAFASEPSEAAEVQSAPEMAEAREEEELAAKARASIQVDDESLPSRDLPGVNRDTAGRVNIDSRAHAPSVYDEDEY